MTNKTFHKKTMALEKEVELLRSFIIGQAGRDPEGNYNPEFVEDILESLSDSATEHTFKNKGSFLKYLNGNR